MTRSLNPAWLAASVVMALGLSAGAQGGGALKCEITENGKSASGTVTVLRGEAQVASGSCGKALDVPAGDYTAVLALDGVLDGPQQRQAVSVGAGKTAQLSADFATGVLEVRIERAGRPAAGMAIIRRDGKQIGTLGGGVAAHLSEGTYEVLVRYRKQEKRFETVAIAGGQRVALDATFE